MVDLKDVEKPKYGDPNAAAAAVLALRTEVLADHGL